MILVTLGTQDKGFARLLDAIQIQIHNGNMKEKVMVQAGHTAYKSDHMEIFSFVPMDQFDALVDSCDILITHGGVGSIITGLKKNKKVIAAARLAKYGEHTNDHQLQIIENFCKEGYILELHDFEKLDEVIKKAKNFEPKKFISNNDTIIKIIDSYIKSNNHNLKILHRFAEIGLAVFMILLLLWIW